MPPWSLGLLENAHLAVPFGLIQAHWPVGLKDREERGKPFRMEVKRQQKDAFDILRHANDLISTMQICTNYLIRAFGNGCGADWYGVCHPESSLSRVITPLGRRALVCRLCSVCWAERLTGLPFLSSTLLQTRGRSPTAHT